MAQFPCLPLWTDAWKADTDHLTRAERGLYLDLLILMWRTPGCKVPADQTWIARHLRLTAEETATLIMLIKEFCTTDGNFITQKRLTREFRERWQFKGRMTAARKAHKNKKNGA